MYRAAFLLSLAASMAAPAGAQYQPVSDAQRVEIEDLLRRSHEHHGNFVTVAGDLRSGDIRDTENEIYELRDTSTVRTVRVGEPYGSMRDLRFLQGRRVEITGIFWDLSRFSGASSGQFMPDDRRVTSFPGAFRDDIDMMDKQYFIGVTSVVPLDDEEEATEEGDAEEEDLIEPEIEVAPGELIDLRALITKPDPYLGKRVAVVGKFRGNNLYGDLSIRSKKTPRDFVLKVSDLAIWVTGKRPRGKGFRLDPKLRRDTGKWLKVSGYPWMAEGMVYLRAERIDLVDKPEDPDLEPVDARPGEEAEKEAGPPPEVIFSLPLDGERRLPLDSEFRVQFSKDMDRPSFDRNVDLLYADDDGFANPFPDIEIRYEPGSRTLVVIPGARLQPGKEIRLVLYDGIRDKEGQSLVARAGAEAEDGAAVILTFFTSP